MYSKQNRPRSTSGLIVAIILGVILGQSGYKIFDTLFLDQWVQSNISLSGPAATNAQTSSGRSMNETCAFWQQQLDNDDSSHNRAMRDSACARTAAP